MYNLISFSSISQHTLIPFFMSCFSFNPLFSRLSWFSRLKLDLNFLRFAPVRKFSDGDGDEYSLGLLDLPELTLECILERLTPVELCRMGAVCTDLRERCGGNHFWARHMEQKWGRVVGDLSRREWLSHVRKTRRPESIITSNRGSFRALCETVFGVWPFFSRPFGCRKLGHRNSNNPLSPETEDSIMSQYVAFESGQFWFPAQVHNRENGQAGFFLSCYDAHISYDWKTDTFRAKYPSQYFTSRMIEENIPWSRIRAAAVDTPPYELHISDCLEDLKPGDSIEIQWRKSDEFAYGWWYGVVGHDEGSCDGNENHCQCHCSETVTLEFNQYPANSRWRRTRINRIDHRQEGNKEKGFYGGIRKLYTDKEISTWRRLLPAT